MPLLDHFHAPLDPRRAWESFHSRWANSIADQLNETLPQRFFAQVQIRLGSQVEADVVEFELSSGLDDPAKENGAGGVAVQAWAPPVAALTMPVVFPDVFRVIVRDELDGASLVAVVELVSPSNKDRPDSRLVFAGKTAAYLQRGVGLMIVDIVTNRHFNLHDQLHRSPRPGLVVFSMPGDTHLSTPSPIALFSGRGQSDQIEICLAGNLSVGSPLPVLPLCGSAARTLFRLTSTTPTTTPADAADYEGPWELARS